MTFFYPSWFINKHPEAVCNTSFFAFYKIIRNFAVV